MKNTERIMKDLRGMNPVLKREATLIVREATYAGYDITPMLGLLGRLLEDPDVPTRCYAANALAYHELRMGEFRHATPLLKHPDFHVKDNAARALADHYLSKPDFGNIEMLLEHTDKTVWTRALWRINDFVLTCTSVGRLELLKNIVKANKNPTVSAFANEIAGKQNLLRLAARRRAEQWMTWKKPGADTKPMPVTPQSLRKTM